MNNPKVENGKYSLGAIFLIPIGLWISYLGLNTIRIGLGSTDWPTVEGVIIQSDYAAVYNDGGTEYRPSIQYGYQINGKDYSSTLITLTNPRLDLSLAGAKSFLAKYPVGSKTLVHYNPKKPAESVMIPGLATMRCALFLTGFSILAVGIYAFIKTGSLFKGIHQINDEKTIL